MTAFEELVESRKTWIENVLRPWCRRAPRADLRRAELEWPDIAGRADPDSTLWTWAWSRFPALVHEGLSGIDETKEVRVRLQDGREFVGYPDNRQSQRGDLILAGRSPETSQPTDWGPFSIDDIAAAEAA